MNPRQPLRLGVAPLSALDLPPAEYIRAAAAAGFAAVGLRLHPVSPSDPPFPLDPRTAEFRDVAAALEETGTEALDAEVFSITPATRRAEWQAVLDAAEALGIRYLNVVGDHPHAAAFADTVEQLSIDARAHGVLPVLEPIAYRQLDNYDDAVALAQRAGCAVELDLLHFMRTGARLETVANHPLLFPILQLCDAPLLLEDHGTVLEELAGGTDLHLRMVAESRFLRLPPGAGDAPIHALLEVLPDSVHLSVEVPNLPLRGGLPAGDYLRLLHRSASEYLQPSSDWAFQP
jgi:sugar phosphate isomerase/epimerase